MGIVTREAAEAVVAVMDGTSTGVLKNPASMFQMVDLLPVIFSPSELRAWVQSS